MHVEAMIATHPQWRGEPASGLVRCVELCFDCAQSCIACADACLGEANVSELRRCISLNLDCADACFATGAMGSRQIGASDVTMRLMLQACAEACRVCGIECESHAMQHEHCKVCAEVCRACERACREAVPKTAMPS